jgi:hypothetical protein
LGRGEIAQALNEQFGDHKATEEPQLVTNALGPLVRSGVILRREDDGKYVIA